MNLSSRSWLLWSGVAILVMLGALQKIAAAGPVGYLYARVDVTGGTSRLYGFQVDPTGLLTSLPGFPLYPDTFGSVAFGTERLAYNAINKQLYAVNDGRKFVSVYAVDLATGGLTSEFGPYLGGTGDWDCSAVPPNGSPLVVGDGVSGTLASFAEPGGNPPMGSPFSTGTARPFSCVFSQDGAFVYAGGNGNPNGGQATIAGFSVDSVTGALTPLPGSPFGDGSIYTIPFATDGTGRLFFADFFGGLLRVFTTSGGVPTGVPGNPFASGLTEQTHAVLHPAGFYMVTDFLGNQVGVYQVVGDGAATTLTPVSGSPFPSGGTGPRVLALSQTGDLLFAANSTSHNITAFVVDALTGSLTSSSTQLVNTLGNTGTITGLAFAPISASSPSLASIAVTPVNPSISLGTTLAFAATGSYSDGSKQDLTSAVTWTSSTPAVASIGATGVATAAGLGSTTISATLDGISGSMVLTVTPAVTTTTLASSENPSVVGHTVTFTATVGGFTPTGTVTFTVDGGAQVIGPVPLSAGTATITLKGFSPGLHSIVASYSGDSNNTASDSPSFTQVVNTGAGKVPTTTTLTVSNNTPTLGQTVTLTATVSGAVPTGTVTFYDFGTVLAVVPLSPNGVASATLSVLTQSAHKISAVYGGDVNNLPSTSPWQKVQVQ